MPTDPEPSGATTAGPASTAPAAPVTVSPAAVQELAAAVRRVAGVLEETGAALVTAGRVAAPAPAPVPAAAAALTADARAALLAEAAALHRVAQALVSAAEAYAGVDSRLAVTLGSR